MTPMSDVDHHRRRRHCCCCRGGGWRLYAQLTLFLLVILVWLFQSYRMVEWKWTTGRSSTVTSSSFDLFQESLQWKQQQSSQQQQPPIVDSQQQEQQQQPALLRNIRMVMIGDSVMRYQYLSLVYRLRHGVWFDNSQSSFTYHFVQESSFQNPFHRHTWGEFLFQTNRILQPYEVCDCYRKPVQRMEDIIENRYYYDPILNNSVVFFLAYGHKIPIYGRLPAQSARNNRTYEWQTKAISQWERTEKCCWEYREWSKMIRRYIQYLDPTPRHIVMNAGLWQHRFGAFVRPPPAVIAPSSQRSFNETINSHNATTIPKLQSSSSPTAAAAAPVLVYTRDTKWLLQVMNETPHFHYTWRTTTCWRDRQCLSTESDHIMCDKLHTCSNVSYTQQVRPDLYWDNGHFFEPVYRAFNEDLLGQLGYLPQNYRRMNVSDILV